MSSPPGEPSSLRSFVRRHRRILLGILAGIVLLEGAYLIAGNLFLRSGWGERVVNRKPGRMQMEWSDGWTAFPGHLRLRDFRIRGQSGKVQWFVTAETASGRLTLSRLPFRTVRVRGIRARGVDFALRRRADVAPRPEIREFRPEIPGLENPPVDPPPRPDRLPEEAWRVDLGFAGLDDVREIWIEEYRFRGRARVEGGFDLRLRRTFELRPAELAVESGALRIVGEDALVDLHGEVTARTDRFDHPETPARLAVERFDGSIRLVGAMQEGESLPLVRRAGGSWLRPERVEGSFALEAALAKGRLVPGGALTMDDLEMELGFLSDHAEGRGELAWQSHDRGWTLHAALRDVGIRRSTRKDPHLRARAAYVRAQNPSLRLLDLNERPDVTVGVVGGRIGDMRVYNESLPGRLRIEEGSASFSGRLHVGRDRSRGSARLVAPDLRVRFGNEVLAGDLSVDAKIPAVDLEAGRFAIDGTRIRLDDAARLGNDAPRDWWSEVVVRSGALRPGADPLLDATIEGTARSATPIVRLFAERTLLPDWIAGVLDLENLETSSRVRGGPGGLVVDDLALTAEDLELRANLDLGRVRQGALYLRYGIFDLGVGLKGEERDVRLLRPREWYRGRGHSLPDR